MNILITKFQISHFYNNNCKNISLICDLVPVFQPESNFKIFWDAIILIVSLFLMFVLTMRISFGIDNGMII